MSRRQRPCIMLSMTRLETSIGILAVIGAVVLSLATGAVSIDLVTAVLHPKSVPHGVIFWDERLPRTLMALIIGGGLAVAGTGFQALLQNPLADPYIIGVSGGAAVGGTLAAVLLPWPVLTIPSMALIGAALSTWVLYRLSLDATGTLRVYRLLLIGVVFNAFAGAMILLLRGS